MNKSSFFSLNYKDLLRGFIVAFITIALGAVVTVLDAGQLPTLADLKSAGLAGLVSGLAYIIKNLLTNSDDQMLKKELRKRSLNRQANKI